MRHIAVLDAPSNLGLRPPTATSVPGCAKAPGALRDHGLLTRLGARDAGCLTPPRYDAGDWRPGDGVAHAQQIAAYSRRLADRIGAILDAGEFPVILGGDCSILLGSGIAMHRLGEAVGGRIGLVFVDGHSDFRHPGNASYVGAAAGEDLALVTGRGQADLASIEGRRPYFRDIDVVVLGIRAQDEYRLDLQAAGIVTRPVPALRAEGAARSAQWARDQLADCAGYWVHVDVDVLDPAVMPAVDAPSPGGIAFPELELLLAGLVESPHCLGVELTVFDPDYDPDGEYAAEITSTVTAGLAPAKTVALRPDLAAARRDLDQPPEADAPGRAGAAGRRFPSPAAGSRTPEATLTATTRGAAAEPATTLRRGLGERFGPSLIDGESVDGSSRGESVPVGASGARPGPVSGDGIAELAAADDAAGLTSADDAAGLSAADGAAGLPAADGAAGLSAADGAAGLSAADDAAGLSMASGGAPVDGRAEFPLTGDSAEIAQATDSGEVASVTDSAEAAPGDVSAEVAPDAESGEPVPASEFGDFAPAGDFGDVAPLGDSDDAGPVDSGEAAPVGDSGEAALVGDSGEPALVSALSEEAASDTLADAAAAHAPVAKTPAAALPDEDGGAATDADALDDSRLGGSAADQAPSHALDRDGEAAEEATESATGTSDKAKSVAATGAPTADPDTPIADGVPAAERDTRIVAGVPAAERDTRIVADVQAVEPESLGDGRDSSAAESGDVPAVPGDEAAASTSASDSSGDEPGTSSGDAEGGDAEGGEPEGGEPERNGAASQSGGRPSRLGARGGSADGADSVVLMRPRPLGSAPLLDSEPLPATRPGMLRPRRAEASEDEPASESFSLPAQRPAFDAGSGEPADIA